MKKILALVLTATIVFCFGACSKNTKNAETKNTESTTVQSKGSNTESTTVNKDGSKSTTAPDDKTGTTVTDVGYIESNEISETPKGAVVSKGLKASKCKANIQSLPCDVESKYLPSQKTKTKSTINKCTYSFVDNNAGGSVILKLNISGTKRDDAEDGSLSCGFLIKVFDSKNNLVGKAYALTPKTQNGKDFEYSCNIGGLTDTQYSVSFSDIAK